MYSHQDHIPTDGLSAAMDLRADLQKVGSVVRTTNLGTGPHSGPYESSRLQISEPGQADFDASAAAVGIQKSPTSGTGELKFVVPETAALEILDWARRRLAPDPHAEISGEDGYHVNTLYLDTPQYAIYRRELPARRGKFRLRRYGAERVIWCEAKRKAQGLIYKRRCPVPESEILSHLNQGTITGSEGRWFQEELRDLQLQPVCQVTYQRIARIGTSVTGTLRLTLDHDLRAASVAGWSVPGAPVEGPLLAAGLRILELKYRGLLPGVFRELVQDYRLQPASFSKYRQAVEATLPLSQLLTELPTGRVDE